MKRNIPNSVVTPDHPDFQVLSFIETEILKASRGLDNLGNFFSTMLREEIDGIVDTANTNRRSYAELEKVERTYVGTRVEIRLRKFWEFPKGKLDLRVGHLDVDIKHTMTTGWMIPHEAFGKPCVLSAADEKSARCYLGLVIAHEAYLTRAPNQDSKLQLAATAWENIRWLLLERAYPENFWRRMVLDDVAYIFDGESGAERVRRLFRRVLDKPIPRKAVLDVAQQLDPVKRVRKNGGARDQMRREGIEVLSGKYDREKIARLRLPYCGPADFIAHRFSESSWR